MLNYQAKGAGRLDIHTTFYQDVLVQEIPKRMDGEAVEGEEEKEKQSESEDDEQFQFKALDTVTIIIFIIIYIIILVKIRIALKNCIIENNLIIRS